MPYFVNGKTYTDHPLMDEICYNCKKILKGIVLKNDILANKSETANSVQHAEMYIVQREHGGEIPFEVYPFNEEILSAYGYDLQHIRAYMRDRYEIPESERFDLTLFANKYFSDRFEEENDYYRMLMGLPPFNTGEEYYVYITDSDIPSGYGKSVDFSLPLHQQPADLINILYKKGVIDELRTVYPGSNYSYINFLGSKTINLYKARTAGKWDILYMPHVYYLVEDRFTEVFKTTRTMYLNRVYQELYSDNSDYYDQLMIVMLLLQVFNDMIVETPEWYIRRDIFDIRSCQYFLESYGVKFFKQIPLKYQIRIVKNLNKLIKYKSSNRNNYDILDIFNIDNAYINKYWILKNRNMNDDGTYTRFETDDENYELEFISSEISESYDDYIKDEIYRTPYDDITYADKYWDGEDTHSLVKSKTVNKDFTVEGTKYMSIEYHVSLSEYSYQIEYFMGMIMDTNLFLDDITIDIPSIDDTAHFKLTNLFLFLIVMSNSFYSPDPLNDSSNKIIYPFESEGSILKKYSEKYNIYEWKKRIIPEIFQNKVGRIYGFNTEFNRAKMEKFIKEKRHSHFLFGASYNNVDFDNPGMDRTLTNEEYATRASIALEELGINDFIIPGGHFESIDELIGVYQNNTKCYKTLMNAIDNAENEDDKATLWYIFQEMYTRKFDKNLFLLSDNKTYANSLIEVLKDRDYILYNQYMEMIEGVNLETRQDFIRLVMNDVIDTLEYYIKGDGLQYVFGFTSIESFSAIVYYLWLMVNFFKSYKVQLLDPYATFHADNKTMQYDSPSDVITAKKLDYIKNDKQFTSDYYGLEEEVAYKDEVFSDVEIDVVDIYGHFEPDPYDDMNYDCLDAERGETEPTKDLDGGEADYWSTVPYAMVNGGRSSGGKIDIHDINGGDADETFHEYAIVDGGEALNPDDQRHDHFGDQGFTYVLDGAAASGKSWCSNTMYIRIAPRFENDYYYPERWYESITEGDYNFGELGVDAKEIEGEFDFGDINEGGETAKGNYDFEDIDELIAPIYTEEDLIDDGLSNFGDIDLNDETAEGDWDFGPTDEEIDKGSDLPDETDKDYDELSLSNANIIIIEKVVEAEENPDDGYYNFGDVDDLDETAEGDYDFGYAKDEFDPDDGTFFFKDEETGEERAEGMWDFSDTDEGTVWDSVAREGEDYDMNVLSDASLSYNFELETDVDEDSVAHGDYDFEVLCSDDGDDDRVFYFRDHDIEVEFAEGMYDFGDLDEGVDPENIANKDYDFNLLCINPDPIPEIEKPDWGPELVADVRISQLPGNTYLTMQEDGLYLPDVFITESEYEGYVNKIEEDIRYIRGTDFKEIEENIAILSDENNLIKRIQTCLDKFFYPMEYTLNQMRDNLFERRLATAVDNIARKLETEFSDLNPFGWQEGELINDDNGVYNFGDIDERDMSAVGNYDFEDVDKKEAQESVVINHRNYDFLVTLNEKY